MDDSDETTVLYNADCPICTFEIGAYRKHAQDNTLPLRFTDLNRNDLSQWGLTPDTARRRLHVVKSGQLYAGLPAFLVLWSEMPRYRWLARLIDRPVIRPAAGALYDHILAPILYHMDRRRMSR